MKTLAKWNSEKKYGLFLILIAQFLMIILLSCQNPFDPTMKDNIPAGKGSFSLAISGVQTGRTILPTTGLNDIVNHYKLEFFKEGEQNPVVEKRDKDSLSNPIFLDIGTYSLTVTAYTDINGEFPVASGSLSEITISPRVNTSGEVMLLPVIENGIGTFSWDIDFPDDITGGIIEITPILGGESKTISLKENNSLKKTGSESLNTGYYRVVFKLERNVDGEILRAWHKEILHIYPNMTSGIFKFTFTASHFSRSILVTNGNNDGVGSLREAIEDVSEDGVIIIDKSIGEISLNGQIKIDGKYFTIEGNGATLIPSDSDAWNEQLLNIKDNAYVKINRIHFKKFATFDKSGSVIINYGTLTLESCIFSANKTTGDGGLGSVIYNGGTLSIMGCTFYANKAEGSGYSSGGAIYNEYQKTLIITGNLFYGNIDSSDEPVAVSGIGNVYSEYNVFDYNLGQINWADKSDKEIFNPTFHPDSFKLIPDAGAENVIDKLPSDYPAADFYGYAIKEPASAGAVQNVAQGYVYVYFDSNEGSHVPPVFLIKGEYVREPAKPILPGFALKYWYTTKNNVNTPWNFTNNKVNENTTLRAEWEAKTYTVKYDTDGGTPLIGKKEGIYWCSNDLLPYLTNGLSKLGHTFTGDWYVIKNDLTYIVNELDTYGGLVENDEIEEVTLTAQWTLNKYTVIFDKNHNDGSVNTWTEANPTSKSVYYGSTLTDGLPTPPTRTSYTFNNWNTEADGSGDTFDENTPVTGDKTVYAQWVLTYNVSEKETWYFVINTIKEDLTNDEYIINITTDEIIIELFDDYTFGLREGITVTIQGKNNLATTLSTSSTSLLKINSKQTIIVMNLSLKGSSLNSAPLVIIDGGNFIMESGSSVSNNSNPNYNGGGVRVEKNGIFTMKDGSSVNGNTASSGGGVYVDGGTFNMDGGTIEGNFANSSGGGVSVVNLGGIFKMTAGIIKNNKAKSSGGGVYVSGGVANFNKSGGIIFGKNASSDDANVADDGQGNGIGHAVYVDNREDSLKRDTTADENTPLDSSKPNINWE